MRVARSVNPVFDVDDIEQPPSRVTFSQFSTKQKLQEPQQRVVDAYCRSNFTYEMQTNPDQYACFLCAKRILPPKNAPGLRTVLAKKAVANYARESVFCERCCHAVYCSMRCRQFDYSRHSRHACKLAFFYAPDLAK